MHNFTFTANSQIASFIVANHHLVNRVMWIGGVLGNAETAFSGILCAHQSVWDSNDVVDGRRGC